MMQFWIICGYLALLLLLGVFASRLFRGTSNDYLLASHSIGPFLLLMSLFGTTMTAFALVGSSGEAFTEGVGVYGLMASSSGIIHSLCFLLVGVKLWSLGKRHGYVTQIQFFRDRLESDAIGYCLFPVLVGLVIPYLLIGVIASGTVIQVMTAGAFPDIAAFATKSPGTSGGVPPWLGSLVICAVVLIYVFAGGMRGTAWANAFQTLVFMVLGVVTFFVIANRLGGEESVWDNLQTLGDAIPHEKATRVDMSKTIFASYLLIPFSVGMFPHLFQHWLTAKSARSFKLSVVAHPIFIMIVWAPCVLIGVWAATDLVQIPPRVAANPNAILPFLVNKMTTPVLSGCLTAGILAAIMSSLDSQFLCLGTIFSNDIVVHRAKNQGRDIDDRTKILLARLFIIAIVAVTYVLSLFQPGSVFALGVWCFSGFASLFPLVVAAVYWRGLTKWGAIASVLTTITVWGVLFGQAVFRAIEAGNPNPIGAFTLDVEWGGTTYQTMPVAAIFLCSLIAMIVVSLVTPDPSEPTLRKFFPQAKTSE